MIYLKLSAEVKIDKEEYRKRINDPSILKEAFPDISEITLIEGKSLGEAGARYTSTMKFRGKEFTRHAHVMTADEHQNEVVELRDRYSNIEVSSKFESINGKCFRIFEYKFRLAHRLYLVLEPFTARTIKAQSRDRLQTLFDHVSPLNGSEVIVNDVRVWGLPPRLAAFIVWLLTAICSLVLFRLVA